MSDQKHGIIYADFHYKGDHDIQDVSTEVDYSVTHPDISHTELTECDPETSTLTVACHLELDLDKDDAATLVEDVEHSFVMPDGDGSELDVEFRDIHFE